MSLFTNILSQLLQDPNPASPLNPEAASVFNLGKEAWEKAVRAHVAKYAAKGGTGAGAGSVGSSGGGGVPGGAGARPITGGAAPLALPAPPPDPGAESACSDLSAL